MANLTLHTQPSIVPSRYVLPLILTGLFQLGGCATFQGFGGPDLREEINTIISAPPLDQVHWGIRIVDPELRQVLYSRNGHRKFVPASNMKILATATALSRLGPAYRYETELWGVGRLEERSGVLEGDLVLRATGDPTLSERFYPSAEAPLDSLAEGLWTAGVRRVTGALVVDASAWDSTTVPGSMMVQNLAGTSGATGGAFALAEGVLTIEVTGAQEPGGPAQSRWWPWADNDFISAAFVTTHPDSSGRGRETHYLPESGRLRIEGRVRTGEVDTVRVSQREPVSLASAALLHALEQKGIQVTGGLRIAWETGEAVGPGECVTGRQPGDPAFADNSLPHCSGATRYTTLTSSTMAEIVKAILEPSQNWMTEQLVRTLGMEGGRTGSWREGFRVEREFLVEEVGVDSLDITFQDGSGLSAYNLVTPRAVVQILEYVRESDFAEIYRDALAGPGEEDSTLRRRLTGLEGRLFAKTGTITHVNSLSGYVIADSGRELIFSILTNGSGLSSGVVRTGIDQLVEVVSRR